MFTKFFLSLKNFPEWFKALKTRNLYLYYGLWFIAFVCLVLIVNFFTFRSMLVYSLAMMAIPAGWTLAQVIWLGFSHRKGRLGEIEELVPTILLPHRLGILTDILASLMIIYTATRFNGSENDYLYTLILVFILKIGLGILIKKSRFKFAVYFQMFLLIISVLLSFIIYSLAVTV